MKKILTIIFIFASLFASSQELMNKNFEGFRVKVSELVIDNDTLNMSGTGGIEANSIDVDTMKINGVPLLLNTFKKDSLGGAGNIFYSTGASSQPASGTVNQVIGNNYIQNQNSSAQNANIFINGAIKTSNRSGYYIGSKLIFSDYSWGGDNSNLWIGGAANNTVSGTLSYEGNYNICIGLYAGQNLTTGRNNLNFGSGSGLNQKTAISNINIGQNTGYNQINAFGNINIGAGSSFDQINTYNSVTVGYNTGLGVKYGVNNSIFGSNVSGLSENLIDNIILATGQGTIRARFNNGSWFLPNLGINKTDPAEKLDVNGNIIGDTIKARADIIVTGEIYDEINHLYGMVYDSTITLSLTQNIWQQVTNPTKTLYSTAEQNGVTISGDTIVFSKAGGYDVYFEINCTGIDSKDYHYRILQKNGTTTVRSYNKYASTGTQVLRNEKAYVHVAAGSKVWCEIMSPSSAPGSITIQGAKIYAMQRYLEK